VEEKDSGVKLCMLVRLLSRMSFSHFGELWLAGSHGGGITSRMYSATNWMQALAPARLGGDSELGAVARWDSRNWGRWRCLMPYGGICILQAC